MYNWLDYVIFAIIFISTLVSVWRGFTKEVLSLIAIILSIWVMLTFGSSMATYLEPYVDNQQIRVVLAFLALFLMTLIVATVINRLLTSLIGLSGLSTYDRLLGTIFGATRAGILIVFFVLLASLTSLSEQQWWKSSLLMPYFESIADWLHQFLPEKLQEYFHFNKETT